jgi:biotin synthase
MNPSADIRIAAGRELYLRGLEPLALYPANSLFLSGYLNVKGGRPEQTLTMIRDARFTVRSEFDIDELLGRASAPADRDPERAWDWKNPEELHPGLKRDNEDSILDKR